MSARTGTRALVALALAAIAAAAAAGPAAATIVGDPTLTIGAGNLAGAVEIDLGIGGDIETNRLFLRGDYGLAPNVDGFLRVGGFDGEHDGPGDVDIEGYGIGGGVRLDLQRQNDWHFGGLGQVMWFSGEETVTVPILGTRFERDFDWLEFDVAGVGSYRALGQVVPYGGAKIGLVTGDPDTDLGFTLFAGATFQVNDRLAIGGELRIIDDDALGLFARYRF